LSDSDSEPRSLGRGKKQGSKHMVVPVTAQTNPPSPNDVYRKKKKTKKGDFKKGGNRGLQGDGRKLVTLFCNKLVKRMNIKMASWAGDTFGLSKVSYEYEELESAYNSVYHWSLEVSDISATLSNICVFVALQVDSLR
jgi:hypothetical protein